MKVEQRRPRLKPGDIYALAHKNVPEREALERLNKGDKTTVTYTHRPSHNKTAVNAVNVNATAEPNTADPADTSVNAVGHSKPPANKTVDPGLKPPPSFWFPCSNHWKPRKQTDMEYHIDWGVTNNTLWTCKPNSPCTDTHGSIAGKSKGGKHMGGGGDKGGGGGKGGGGKGDKGGKGAPYRRGRL